MTADYSGFQNIQPLRPDVGSGMIYDGTSSESSAASPLYSNQSLDPTYGDNVAEYLRNAYPVQDPVTAASMGLIPVELDIDGLYETQDRRRKKSTGDKAVPPHVHSRRRAQNRASQRAFRDRKEKRMKEIEEKLTELQGEHSDLARSYETLQGEYAKVKQELEALRRKHDDGTTSPGSSMKGWDESEADPTDPLLFDVSAFCYEQAE